MNPKNRDKTRMKKKGGGATKGNKKVNQKGGGGNKTLSQKSKKGRECFLDKKGNKREGSKDQGSRT
jgi:hypothetical protein